MYTHDTREGWLTAARDILAAELFTPRGYDLPATLLSVGFPDRNPSKVVGQCWAGSASADGARQIFISPILDELTAPSGVLPTLIHELLHAALPPEVKHRGRFITGMRRLGLEGKPTSTRAGDELLKWLRVDVSPRLGPYPHAKLTRTVALKTQRNRHRKYICGGGCGQIIRAATNNLNVVCGKCEAPFEMEAA